MSQGIVAYFTGKSNPELPVVFLHSLKKFYSGNIHIVFDNVNPEIIRNLPKYVTYSIDEQRDNFGENNGKEAIWMRKASFHQTLYPYDVNLYYDIDRVFYSDIDEEIFDLARKYEIVSSSDVYPWENQEFYQLHAYNKLDLKFNSIDWADGGCVCAVKKSNLVDLWMRYMKAFRHLHAFQDRSEERALCILLSDSERLIGPKWNSRTDGVETISKHLHMGRWDKSSEWINEYNEAYDRNFMGVQKWNSMNS